MRAFERWALLNGDNHWYARYKQIIKSHYCKVAVNELSKNEQQTTKSQRNKDIYMGTARNCSERNSISKSWEFMWCFSVAVALSYGDRWCVGSPKLRVWGEGLRGALLLPPGALPKAGRLPKRLAINIAVEWFNGCCRHIAYAVRRRSSQAVPSLGTLHLWMWIVKCSGWFELPCTSHRDM